MNLNTKEILKSKNIRSIYIIISALFITIILAVFFISMGEMKISFVDTYKIIFGKISGSHKILENFRLNEIAVIWEIRLPRVLCSIFIGMGLAVSGVIFQSVLINPLADPYTLGVSTGAAFGACIAIFINITSNIFIPVTPFAFLWAFIALITVIFIAQKGGGLLSSNLIIAGIIVSSILSSGISFIKFISNENVGAIVFWIMGSLTSKNWQDVILVSFIVTICIIIAFIFADTLNIMAIGEKTARSLGVNTSFMRLLYIVLGAVITAACVSVSGVIGFIGLVVPHILRMKITSDNKILIPCSAVFGGLLLMLADNFTRLMPRAEIPVGVITTLIGGPFFIYIFIKKPS